jgi:hypothetical protein
MFHKTKDGRNIHIASMDDNHLLNTYNLLKQKAQKGFIIRDGGGNFADEMWFEENFFHGKEALEKLNIRAYMLELLKRDLLDLKEAVLYLLE